MEDVLNPFGENNIETTHALSGHIHPVVVKQNNLLNLQIPIDVRCQLIH